MQNFSVLEQVVLGFKWLNGDVIHAYLGYNIFAVSKQLMGSTPLFKEMSRESTYDIIINMQLMTQFCS
jgi:hypothetical protein